MYKIRRTFTFCAAHRIEGHPKCGRLHGHNYEVTVTLMDTKTDEAGMVLDFGDLDAEVKPIIDAMDHRYLVSSANLEARDPYSVIAMGNGDAYMLECKHSTAEHMAQMIHEKVCYKLSWPPYEVIVEVQETPRNVATYT